MFSVFKMIYFIYLLLVTVSVAETSHCQEELDNFVCAVDNANNQNTFNNECNLEEYNLEHEECQFTKIHDGECCEQICNEECGPICARNRKTGELKTFTNGCQLDLNNCKCGFNRCDVFEGFHYGSCCNVCDNSWDPVCAQAGDAGEYRTFKNEDWMHLYNNFSSSENDRYTALHQDICTMDFPEESCTGMASDGPICGQNEDGVYGTFDNICAYNQYNMDVECDDVFAFVHRGICDCGCYADIAKK